jgi:uncharacterized protein with HEPN domain
VEDILGSIEKVQRYTQNLSFEEFCLDDMAIDAVIRNFGIIGEAARYITAAIQDRYPAIPWAKMRGMRNAVIHGYDEVNLSIVWSTIRDDLPPLMPLLQDMLRRES